MLFERQGLWILLSRRVALFLVVTFSISSHALTPYVTQARSISQQTESLLKQLKDGGEKAKLHDQAEAALKTVTGELDEGFAPAISQVLNKMQTPSSTYLQKLKDEIDGDLKQIRATADEKGS